VSIPKLSSGKLLPQVTLYQPLIPQNPTLFFHRQSSAHNRPLRSALEPSPIAFRGLHSSPEANPNPTRNNPYASSPKIHNLTPPLRKEDAPLHKQTTWKKGCNRTKQNVTKQNTTQTLTQCTTQNKLHQSARAGAPRRPSYQPALIQSCSSKQPSAHSQQPPPASLTASNHPATGSATKPRIPPRKG